MKFNTQFSTAYNAVCSLMTFFVFLGSPIGSFDFLFVPVTPYWFISFHMGSYTSLWVFRDSFVSFIWHPMGSYDSILVTMNPYLFLFYLFQSWTTISWFSNRITMLKQSHPTYEMKKEFVLGPNSLGGVGVVWVRRAQKFHFLRSFCRSLWMAKHQVLVR